MNLPARQCSSRGDGFVEDSQSFLPSLLVLLGRFDDDDETHVPHQTSCSLNRRFATWWLARQYCVSTVNLQGAIRGEHWVAHHTEARIPCGDRWKDAKSEAVVPLEGVFRL